MLDAGKLFTTKEAAEILRLSPQTLRRWACYESGPIKPVRVCRGQLRWRGGDLNRVTGAAQ